MIDTIFDRALLDYLKSIYQLDWDFGTHGIRHWERVYINGQTLAEMNGANRTVVSYFAILHDICRLDEWSDPQHGVRASYLIRETLQPKFLRLPEDDLELLCTACALHVDGLMDGDLTVRTCWDSDRLDLGRVGIIPDPARLATSAARSKGVLRAAYHRSIMD
ncbi:MAG: hypothetical protein JW750_07860 [Anaerolineaceae bacterium]|nr:hypothetical protein [Anaerolineaceae bacterium]